MGRKRNRGAPKQAKTGQQHREQDESDDGSESEISVENTGEAIDVEELIEKLSGNTAKGAVASRCAAYAALSEFMRKHVSTELVEQQGETLLAIVRKSCRKGGAQEIALAVKLAGLIVVTEGAGGGAWKDMKDILRELAKRPVFAAKAECVEALSGICFICCEEDDETLELVEFLKSILKTGTSESATVSTLLMLGLVLTVNLRQKKTHLLQLLPQVIEYLEHKSQNIRLAAAEMLGLVLELVHAISHGESDFDSSELEDIEGIDVNAIRDTVKALAIARDRSRAKKELKEQREIFRQLLAFIERGFSELRWLNWLRGWLGSGIGVFLVDCDFVHQLFGLGSIDFGQPIQSLSSTEKRLYMSPNSAATKERHLERRKDRTRKRVDNSRMFDGEVWD